MRFPQPHLLPPVSQEVCDPLKGWGWDSELIEFEAEDFWDDGRWDMHLLMFFPPPCDFEMKMKREWELLHHILSSLQEVVRHAL